MHDNVSLYGDVRSIIPSGNGSWLRVHQNRQVASRHKNCMRPSQTLGLLVNRTGQRGTNLGTYLGTYLRYVP
jgi:hypothetical protein